MWPDLCTLYKWVLCVDMKKIKDSLEFHKILKLTVLLVFIAFPTFSQTKLSDTEKDLLQQLGISSVEEFLKADSLLKPETPSVIPAKPVIPTKASVIPVKASVIPAKAGIQKPIQKPVIRYAKQKPNRAPSDLQKPVFEKAPKKELSAKENFSDFSTVLSALEDEFFESSSPAKAGDLRTEESRSITATQREPQGAPVIPTEAPVILSPKGEESDPLNIDAIEINLPVFKVEEKPSFQYTDKKFQEYVSAGDQAVTNHERKVFQANAQNSPLYKPVNLAYNEAQNKSAEEEKETKKIYQHKFTPAQNQELETLKQEVALKEEKLKEAAQNSEDSKKMMEDFRRLLQVDQKEKTPVSVQTQPDRESSVRHSESGARHLREGGDPFGINRLLQAQKPSAFEREKQKIALESLSRIISDPQMQAQKPQLVYEEIINKTIAPKIDQTIEAYDLDLHKAAIRTFENVDDGKLESQNVSKKINEALVKVDESLLRDTSILTDILDESLVDLISSDPTAAVRKIETAIEVMEKGINILIEMENFDEAELLARFKNKDRNLETRRMAALLYLKRMMDKGKGIKQKDFDAIQAFLEKYKLEEKENFKDTVAKKEKADCEDNSDIQETIERMENLQTMIAQIDQKLNRVPTGIQKEIFDHFNLAIERTQGAKVAFEAKAKAAKAGSEEERICVQGSEACDRLKQELQAAKESMGFETTNQVNVSEEKIVDERQDILGDVFGD